MQTFKPFDRFVCIGDSRSVDVGPLRVVATIHADHDTTPEDFEHFGGTDHVDAWSRGEWFYCGIVLSVWCDEVCLTDHAASLWAIEANYPDSDHSYLTECANELIDEAVREGQTILARLQSVAA
jgi:hypothetical protein